MKTNSPLPSQSRLLPSTLAALVGIQVAFAFNYLFSKIVMKAIPPLVWGNLRAALAAIVLTSLLLLTGNFNWKEAWAVKKQLFIFSFLGVAVNQAAFLAGLNLTTTTNSALINTMIPIFTVLWVTLGKEEKLSWYRWIGLCLAFLGVILLRDLSRFSFSHSTYRGDALSLLNSFCYSIFLAKSSRFFKGREVLWTTTWLFICGSLWLTVVAIPQWPSLDPTLITPRVILFALLGVVVGTCIPYVLISYALGRTQSSIVSQFIYLQALLATLLGYFFLGESITMKTLFSGALIFLGLYLSISKIPFGIQLIKK
jgi:drug/metabolite transporter (DMT)-like permease